MDAFLRYVEAVTKALGDRVGDWMTHNEPWVVAFMGYAFGDFAPGFEGLHHGRTAFRLNERQCGNTIDQTHLEQLLKSCGVKKRGE